MALRALMKRKELDRLNAELETLREKVEGFEAREADIAKMIEEAETEEERSAVQEEIEAFETERDETNGQIAELEERVSGIEEELDALEDEQEPEPPAPTDDPDPIPEENERSITMETRVAMLAIIVREGTAVAELNDLLHQYGKYIIGRMGVPYHARGVNIISVAMDAPADVISALSGKIGRLSGITAKTVYAPENAL